MTELQTDAPNDVHMTENQHDQEPKHSDRGQFTCVGHIALEGGRRCLSQCLLIIMDGGAQKVLMLFDKLRST